MGRAFEFRKARKLKRWSKMSKTFTRIGKDIVIAVKEGGPNPETNSRLRQVMQNAKSANMPKDNVIRAIKKASDKSTSNYNEISLEGYAPFGVAVFVECATNNNNRTVADVRSYFSKCDGELGTNGSLEFLFSRKGVFTFEKKQLNIDLEELEMQLIDGGLEELCIEEDCLIAYCDYMNFKNMQQKLEDLGVQVESSELSRIPNSLKKLNLKIKSKFKLKNLKVLCSTGSPLSNEGFEYIYRNVKKNVHLSSISGGTDIVSCFVLGNIFSPVFSGEIQNNGLGMDVDVFSERGESILNQKGELVCKSPFPSMPNKFWNDPGGKKYQSAYFLKYKNIWYHGDYAERKKNGGYIIYGRSDATLNPGGVRLGTAEIYSAIENFKEVKESIVVGQKWDNDVRIILFVVMRKSYSLNDDIILRLKKRIRSEASPRHVPSKIIQVSDIPRTKNGKIVELAVKNTIEGSKIKNVQALANPKVLNEFKNLKQLKF